MKTRRAMLLTIDGHKYRIAISDPIKRGLFRRAMRDVMTYGQPVARANAVYRSIVVAAMRLRSKREMSEHQRWEAATFLIALLSSPQALGAVIQYLAPKRAPLGRLVAEDYATQRALGEKAAVANKIVRDAWGLTEKNVTDHWTHWRSAAEKALKVLLDDTDGLGIQRDKILQRHADHLRKESLTRSAIGEPFEAWSRKMNKVKFRPKRPAKAK